MSLLDAIDALAEQLLAAGCDIDWIAQIETEWRYIAGLLRGMEISYDS